MYLLGIIDFFFIMMSGPSIAKEIFVLFRGLLRYQPIW
jgi:hypothetical protein